MKGLLHIQAITIKMIETIICNTTTMHRNTKMQKLPIYTEKSTLYRFRKK